MNNDCHLQPKNEDEEILFAVTNLTDQTFINNHVLLIDHEMNKQTNEHPGITNLNVAVSGGMNSPSNVCIIFQIKAIFVISVKSDPKVFAYNCCIGPIIQCIMLQIPHLKICAFILHPGNDYVS